MSGGMLSVERYRMRRPASCSLVLRTPILGCERAKQVKSSLVTSSQVSLRVVKGYINDSSYEDTKLRNGKYREYLEAAQGDEGQMMKNNNIVVLTTHG